jgi:hypothetical protein
MLSSDCQGQQHHGWGGVRGVDGTGEKQGLCVVLNETEEQGDIMGLDGSRCAQQST